MSIAKIALGYWGGKSWQSVMPEGLVLEATTDPDSPVLERFYQAYDRAFVLPHEKEDLAGFRACLTLNSGADFDRVSARHRPFREVVLVLSEPDGALIGGANFIAVGHDGVVTVNLNYIFIERTFRTRGKLRALMAAVFSQSRQIFDLVGEPGVLVFIEQNDPMRLSPEDYALDNAHSGLDQHDRLRIWQRLGARLIDFDYVQPALSAEQAPDESLVLGVLGAGTDRISSCLFADHLSSFFGISVLKGREIASDACALRQIDTLQTLCHNGGELNLLDYPYNTAGDLTLLPELVDGSFLDHARALAQPRKPK